MNIGRETTRGLGAGGTPDVGQAAAEESRAEIAAAGRDPDAELPLPGNRKGGKGAGTNASSSAAAASSGGGGKGTPSKDNKGYDEKNIRRRVYDALNVLMAMDIISKEKKQITWKGLPSSAHHDLDVLQRERRGRLEEVRRKQECLQELLLLVWALLLLV